MEQQIDTYCKLKPVYDQYKASKNKDRFFLVFESKTILLETTAKEIKKAKLSELPTAEKLKAELDRFTAREVTLQADFRLYSR